MNYLFRYITLGFTFSFFSCTLLLCLYILSIGVHCVVEECRCPAPIVLTKDEYMGRAKLVSAGHNLAVLVPFRDRFEELIDFIPHMESFLNRQNVNHNFFILNQVDNLRFNRASLINVGFKIIFSKFDYFVMHDVDLLPLRDELSYRYPDSGVYHVSSPDLHPKYHYASFLGGILIIKREVFEKVNGMSNRYWGWGLEDDELYTRLKAASVVIDRPKSVPTNHSNTFVHSHDRERRRRDSRKCFNQLTVTRHRDRVTGLHDVGYNIKSNVSMSIGGIPFTVINIALSCDHKQTPWCQCDKPASKPS